MRSLETSSNQVSNNVVQSLNRMVEMSVDGYYNPYTTFDWPDVLDDDQWWMSRGLTTTYGARVAEHLTESQLMALSKWESINFYGLIVYGIRELMMEVTKRIYSPGFEFASEYFHHFLGEENGHMWFFAKFCQKYGSKMYPDRRVKFSNESTNPDIESFMVFSQILVFEELGDYFNVQMAGDESLPVIVRRLNSVHHQDESRHIAFGRQVVKQLFERLAAAYSPDELGQHLNYLKRYINLCIQNLYNPAVYSDAGVAEPFKFRNQLLQEPGRQASHKRFLKRTTDFFVRNRILPDEDFIQ